MSDLEEIDLANRVTKFIKIYERQSNDIITATDDGITNYEITVNDLVTEIFKEINKNKVDNQNYYCTKKYKLKSGKYYVNFFISMDNIGLKGCIVYAIYDLFGHYCCRNSYCGENDSTLVLGEEGCGTSYKTLKYIMQHIKLPNGIIDSVDENLGPKLDTDWEYLKY
jgi:hypothetical protein